MVLNAHSEPKKKPKKLVNTQQKKSAVQTLFKGLEGTVKCLLYQVDLKSVFYTKISESVILVIIIYTILYKTIIKICIRNMLFEYI